MRKKERQNHLQVPRWKVDVEERVEFGFKGREDEMPGRHYAKVPEIHDIKIGPMHASTATEVFPCASGETVMRSAPPERSFVGTNRGKPAGYPSWT